jgi:hypothetical protein
VIQKTDHVNSGFIEFPFDVYHEFGKKGQVKVKAWFDGFLYRGILVKMGHPCHVIGLNKKVRDAIGKGPGEIVNVVITADTEERVVEVPPALQNMLNLNPEALKIFNKLSFTHRREYAEWIASARKTETLQRRLDKCMSMLLNNNKIG